MGAKPCGEKRVRPGVPAWSSGRFGAIDRLGSRVRFAALVGRELPKLTDGALPDDPVLPIEEMRLLPFHALAPFVAAACIKYCDIVDRRMIRRHRNR